MGVDVSENGLGKFDGERAVGERGEGDDPRERPFELADVRADATRDEGQHLGIRDRDLLGLDPLAQDRDPRLEVGSLDVGQETPLETRAQPVSELADVPWRPVGRDDDLRPALVERVERVEELFLGAVQADRTEPGGAGARKLAA